MLARFARLTLRTFPSRSLSTSARPLGALANRSLLSMLDLTPDETLGLVQQASELKRNKGALEAQPLLGESLAMIFRKRSTRTRVSAETGAAMLGAHALFLGPQDIQLGENESLVDTARVLSRFNSIILARVYEHEAVEVLAREASVPVINALSDLHHPLQALADMQTLYEHFDDLKGKRLAWVGDGNNVLHDLMIGALHMGMHVRAACPEGYEPDENLVASAQELAEQAGAEFEVTTDPDYAAHSADVIVTDTWVSMGQEEEKAKRLADFAGYQVDDRMMGLGSDQCVFLHCLPRKAEEVTDDVFYSPRSLVFDAAENRMWTVMALMLAQLGKC